jgi:AbiU2
MSRKKTTASTESTPPQPTREELVEWLNELESIVYLMKFKQFMFHGTWDVIRGNEELQKRRSHFFDFFTNLYLESMAMAIRRVCDDDSRTLSLVTFLHLVRSNPELVSRAAYASFFPEYTIANSTLPKAVRALMREYIINRDYDNIVGKGLDQPTDKDICRDISSLRKPAKKLLTFVRKRVAHFDREAPKDLPTLADIDSLVEAATKLVQKYLLLLKGSSSELDLHFRYDWLAPFRVAWLPDK